MIYIDPPYNTGNDFIYPDNYTESLDTYLRYSGQMDAEGRKFSTNTEADGRFHSKWLNMMYPRLFLARNLLREDGVMFISIDDNEVDNLKKICAEVFGEESFLACIIWQKIYSGKADATHFGRFHEYILCYAKNADVAKINLLPRTEEMNARYSNPDNDPRGIWLSNDLTAAEERSAGHFEVKSPAGVSFDSPQGKHWLYSRETMNELLADNRVWFGKQGTAFPRLKRFLSEVQQGKRVNTIWLYDEVGSTDEATKELKALFPELQGDFETPKPTRLITQMLQIATASGGNDLVLDFFAGSGTTGESVLKLNAQDGGHRKSLLVQLPQPTGREDLRTIADITRERLRRVAKQMIEEEDAKLPLTDGASSDRGFKAFKLQTSNFKTWNSDLPVETEPEARTAALAKNLEMHVNHLVAGREQDDLLFEILLKSGFPLSVAVERLEIEGKTVFSVAERALLICLDEMVSPEVVKAMAEMKPERVIFLDAGFAGNDQLKTNALQTMKAKGVTSFRTV